MEDPREVGDWFAEKVLGSGGFGIVTLWTNKIMADSLAIKKCKWNLQASITPKQKERWTSEVEILKEIRHPNIVLFRDIPNELQEELSKNNPSGLPLLSMEYCSLGNLRDILTEAKHSCGLPENQVIEILNDISNALIYLHNFNITHRDIKPENVVLQSEHNRKSGVVYKVIDLGYAKELDSATISFVGTLQYLAPEIYGRQNYDKTVDYWSLGIVAFELICGIRPFLPQQTNFIESFQLIQNKKPDVISIQYSNTGSQISSNEILSENRLNSVLKSLIEKWLQTVLQFEPRRRRFRDGTNVLRYLQKILSTKIVTIFSVCRYRFYSYEIDEDTLLSTLEKWLENDMGLEKGNIILSSCSKSESNYVLDHCKGDTETVFYAFQKSSSISETICTSLSPLIKLLFTNTKTKFKYDTLMMLYAHTIFFISQESRHVEALKYALQLEYENVMEILQDQRKLQNIRNFILEFLGEIKFCLFLYKTVMNNGRRLNLLESFYKHIMELKSLFDIVNVLSNRYAVLFKRVNKVQQGMTVIKTELEGFDFTEWYSKAERCYHKLRDDNLSTNDVICTDLLAILSGTIRLRDAVLHDENLLNYIKCLTCCHKVHLPLVTCLTGLQTKLCYVKDKLREIIVEILNNSVGTGFTKGKIGCDSVSTETLIAENTYLQKKLQGIYMGNIVKYKDLYKDCDEFMH